MSCALTPDPLAARGRDRARLCESAWPRVRARADRRPATGLRHNVTARATTETTTRDYERREAAGACIITFVVIAVVVVVRRARGSVDERSVSRARERESRGGRSLKNLRACVGTLQRARLTLRRSGYPGTRWRARAARSDVRLARSDVGLGERARARRLAPFRQQRRAAISGAGVR